MHHPERFAALVIVAAQITEHRASTNGILYPAIAPASAPDPYQAVAKAVSRLPIWILHGDADPTVDESRKMFAALKATDANVQYTEIPGKGHLDGISAAYDNPNVIGWMLKQKQP